MLVLFSTRHPREAKAMLRSMAHDNLSRLGSSSALGKSVSNLFFESVGGGMNGSDYAVRRTVRDVTHRQILIATLTYPNRTTEETAHKTLAPFSLGS